jgi:hypothetical protein
MKADAIHLLEPLEGRTMFASYTAATAKQLITVMTRANRSAEADTIALAAGATFTLKAADNFTYEEGGNALPVITPQGGALTILGNGATIQRSATAGTPAFRFFKVDFNASLTLKDVTLQGGLATPGSGIARGGAIYAGGASLGHVPLNLVNVTVQSNSAVGADGVSGLPWVGSVAPYGAQGGGIYADYFTAQGCIIRNNLAQGGRGAEGSTTSARNGGVGLGGGIFGGGSLTDCLMTGNAARGGTGASTGGGGGAAVGAGAYLYFGTLRGVTVTYNAANGGIGSNGTAGTAYAGGLYSAVGSLELDNFTISNVKYNTANGIEQHRRRIHVDRLRKL